MMNRKGFTLVEIAIALTVVGVLSVMAMPDIATSARTLRLNNAAQRLAGDIRYIRSLALSNHKTYGIDFDLDNDNTVDGTSYNLFELNGGTQTTINDPNRNTATAISFSSQPEFSGVSITSASSMQLRVDEFGKPYNASGAALTATMTITLQSSSLSKNVNITQETSFVEIV